MQNPSTRFLEKNATRIFAPKHLGSSQRPAWLWGAKSTIHRDPKGVVLITSPFNFPLLLAAAPMAQALAAGNTVLLKPARQVEYAANLLVKIAREAGLPNDVLQVMDGSTFRRIEQYFTHAADAFVRRQTR